MIAATVRAVGRRGLVLAVIGIVWLLYGASVGIGEVTSTADVWVLQQVSPTTRAAAWVLTGVLAVYTALTRPSTDTPGFLALTLCPMVYAASYVFSWVLWAVPVGDAGYSLGLIAALRYLAILALIAVVASWPETPTRTEPQVAPPLEV